MAHHCSRTDYIYWMVEDLAQKKSAAYLCLRLYQMGQEENKPVVLVGKYISQLLAGRQADRMSRQCGICYRLHRLWWTLEEQTSRYFASTRFWSTEGKRKVSLRMRKQTMTARFWPWRTLQDRKQEATTTLLDLTSLTPPLVKY
ncbi:uncharacterized protein SPPG_09516 [Spizellomyces punctatus DAOM BR117]|uniref:Uncharacterized protein n=1 Tax=Spizellomyces punctatus (strain DAOM BR117) TaxID=645134 RepID=A0A0L0H6E5_SPIPD|nr:hypothetical protein, variant [Spizellomyces punctatus DAOM BR117]XP_016604832.1 uncharacterized protein SPPG_09516 [Spizellomyces punctatus DAOM BR117]KNC96791.1 hypothetical protein, variant [Spizellomyces punctatus DAOM BR117]KNC96792.1 hypothetical protein SPPG_09516 [Spizellomyces punctatus DAOM BR117]|eukprot:XP_016604831.1 hypothetical protein, variant [Spizellomyces punctatus DAOM BR117]